MSIIIRMKGDSEPCKRCGRDIEIFTQETAQAKFLIVRLANRPILGGGKCQACGAYYCISCATKTVYGAGLRRLHCPSCGRFLVGLRRQPSTRNQMGAFLEDPPEFSGRTAPQVGELPAGDSETNFYELRLEDPSEPQP